jgi:hypothetical protein
MISKFYLRNRFEKPPIEEFGVATGHGVLQFSFKVPAPSLNQPVELGADRHASAQSDILRTLDRRVAGSSPAGCIPYTEALR